LCQEGRHYIGFRNPEDIESKWKSGLNFQQVISNANQFVNEKLSEDGHVKRWIDILKLIEKGV
jgi:hypothetical protein